VRGGAGLSESDDGATDDGPQRLDGLPAEHAAIEGAARVDQRIAQLQRTGAADPRQAGVGIRTEQKQRRKIEDGAALASDPAAINMPVATTSVPALRLSRSSMVTMPADSSVAPGSSSVTLCTVAPATVT